MDIVFTLLLFIITGVLVFTLRLALKKLVKKCPRLQKKPLKYLFDSNTWLIAVSIFITSMLFILPGVWLDNVVNFIVPNAVWPGNNAALDGEAGARGDTFGGTYGPLIGWFAAIVTFAAFWVQYKANEQQKKINKKQRDDIKLERFEARFFKFIDYHRENVNELLYRKPQFKEEEYYKGNQVFTVIYYEIRELLEEYIQNRYDARVISFDEKVEAINFAYQCVFYGAGKHSSNNLTSNFSCLHFNYIDFKEKKAVYSINGIGPHVYYTGHVRRLGHYFRNIYQAVSYLEEQQFLNARQKYEYMSTFRAQMSVYEQAVFFFNSVSDLGKKWEFQEYEKDTADVDKNLIYPELLVTFYDMVRNTLFEDGEVATGIKINEFYPLLNIERREECARSGVLPFRNNTAHICRFCFNKKYFKYSNRQVERKIAETLKFKPTEFDGFRCDEPDCETTEILRRLR